MTPQLAKGLLVLLGLVLLAPSSRAKAKTEQPDKTVDKSNKAADTGHKGTKARVLKYLPLFQKYAGKEGLYNALPLQLALAIAHGEGGGHPSAKSSAGAVGLMQLMKKTARGLGLRVDDEVDERYDPEKNIEAGCRLLVEELYAKYKNWDKVLAAYNSGNPDPDKRRKYINYIYSFLPVYAEYKDQ